MREKHHVIVPGGAVWPYLASGYLRSDQSAAELLGHNWELLSDPDRQDLVVLEIDKEQHDQLNELHKIALSNLERCLREYL